MASTERILILGSEGQLGSELSVVLQQRHGIENVICTDIRNGKPEADRRFVELNVMDADGVEALIVNEKITTIYLLAAVLSAKGEANPDFAWKLNMDSLLLVLGLSVKHKIGRVFWPSSIAAFGVNTPRINTPQESYMDPNTVYGISKLSGELWCQYYFQRYGLDVRSIRYPGIISWKTPPGGGTTDYAVEIFHEALKNGRYTSFLSENTALPMMFVDDAIRATVELMEAPAEQIKVRTSYNLAAVSFTPAELAAAIQKRLPDFQIAYQPDFRQGIANSWPASIDDRAARSDWGWNHRLDTEGMVDEMLNNLRPLLLGQ
jgi:nucleoside-diphosphate-sugar epimerase